MAGSGSPTAFEPVPHASNRADPLAPGATVMKIQASSEVAPLAPPAVPIKTEMPGALATVSEPKATDEEIPFPAAQGCQVHLE